MYSKGESFSHCTITRGSYTCNRSRRLLNSNSNTKLSPISLEFHPLSNHPYTANSNSDNSNFLLTRTKFPIP